ncbi:MAG TPA: site-2 protease family protein [Anaerolineales bacterium]|nr:site-2 protease family protein [Anaerolineales bacterium]HNO32598.1 site-2 protease family protein [Anaerolineales bacterium]
MFIFQDPAPTRFDLRFSIAGIPVRVHPLFWVIALLFASGSSSLTSILTWTVAIFVSILVHELGHAFAMRRYGQNSHIILHLAGGLTVPESVSWGSGYASIALTANQQIIISLAGPFSGFLLAILVLVVSAALGGTIVPQFVLGFIPFPLVYLPIGGGFLNSLFIALLWVNIFWGIVNLMPVFPLDGGHVMRYTLTKRDPWNGLRTSLLVSTVVGVLVAVAGLVLLRSVYMALLFGMLAFQSFQAMQGSAGRF